MLTHWKVFAGPMRELCGGGLAEQDSVIGRVIQRRSRDCRLRILFFVNEGGIACADESFH